MRLLILLISINAHSIQKPAQLCEKEVKESRCEVACMSRDYDGGKVAGKDKCFCWHVRELKQLIDHNIYLDMTSLKKIEPEVNY